MKIKLGGGGATFLHLNRPNGRFTDHQLAVLSNFVDLDCEWRQIKFLE